MKGIGELINEFESLPWDEQNVENFNKLFIGNEIVYNPTSLVEIGELKYGYTRVLKIDGRLKKHDMIPYFDMTLHGNKGIVKLYKKTKELNIPVSVFYWGVKKGDYPSIEEAARKLGLNRKTLQYALKSGKFFKSGYKITKYTTTKQGEDNDIYSNNLTVL